MKTLSLLKTRWFGLLLIASAIIACKKDREPEKTIQSSGDLSYFAKASVPGVKMLNFRSADTIPKVNTVDVAWSSATVYVEKISFVGKSNSLLDTTIKVGKNLNILSTNALAGVIKLPTGSYKDVKVKMYCIKSNWPDLAFFFKGTFTNSNGGTDSILVGSSLPFEANLAVTEIVIDDADNYSAIFNFDLTKVLTGISARQLETSAGSNIIDGKRRYSIFKGGSADEPFYDQVLLNWQTVATVDISRELSGK